jgi:hypothetical protein
MGTDRSTKCDRGAGIKSGDGGERFTAMPVGQTGAQSAIGGQE